MPLHRRDKVLRFGVLVRGRTVQERLLRDPKNRGGWRSRVDWGYASIVMAIALLEFGAAGWMATLERKEKSAARPEPQLAYPVLIRELQRLADRQLSVHSGDGEALNSTARWGRR